MVLETAPVGGKAAAGPVLHLPDQRLILRGPVQREKVDENARHGRPARILDERGPFVAELRIRERIVLRAGGDEAVVPLQRGIVSQRQQAVVVRPEEVYVEVVIPGDEPAMAHRPERRPVGREIADVMAPAEVVKGLCRFSQDGLILCKRYRNHVRLPPVWVSS